MPHIKPYLSAGLLQVMVNNFTYMQVIPLCKQLCTLRWSTDRARISVSVQQLRGILPCLLVPCKSHESLSTQQIFRQTSESIHWPWIEGLPTPPTLLERKPAPLPSRSQRLCTRRHSQQQIPAASCKPSWWNQSSAHCRRWQYKWQEAEGVC